MFKSKKTLEEKIVEYNRAKRVVEVLGEEISNDITRLRNLVDNIIVNNAVKSEEIVVAPTPSILGGKTIRRKMRTPRLLKELVCECSEVFSEGTLTATYAGHRRQFHEKKTTKGVVKFRNSNGQSHGRYSRFYRVIEKKVPTHRSLVICKICSKHVTQGPMPGHVRTQHSEVLAIA